MEGRTKGKRQQGRKRMGMLEEFYKKVSYGITIASYKKESYYSYVVYNLVFCLLNLLVGRTLRENIL